jgi:hypothetical protein
MSALIPKSEQRALQARAWPIWSSHRLTRDLGFECGPAAPLRRLGLFHRLVLNSTNSVECLRNKAIRFFVDSAMILGNSVGDLIVASLRANSKANCVLACAISRSFA